MEISDYPVSQLPDIYGVARSQIYNRFDALQIQPYKLPGQGAKTFISSMDKSLMDRIHTLVSEQGMSLADTVGQMTHEGAFVPNMAPTGDNNLRQDRPIQPQDSLVRQQDSPMRQPYGTQDTLMLSSQVSTEIVETLARAIATAANYQQQDSLDRYRQLEEIADRGWLVSTSELAPILGLKSLNGSEFERYGFRLRAIGQEWLTVGLEG
ncbi:MAG: hypothetical protein ACFB8W_08445 [Elainellaceae cyanobacterium]